jgi:beta-carotene 3-hydroxylase
MPDWLIYLTVFLVVFIGMEGVAWALHRYVMHGFLWVLHESHHRPRKSWFEMNDLFGFFFTAVSVGLFLAGTLYYTPLLFAGLGMTAYGVVYFLIHDVLVHRRVEHGFVPRNGYLRRVYQAHRLHHAVPGRDGAVSFGFVYAPPPEKLAATLKNRTAEEIVAEDRTPAEKHGTASL